MVAYANICALKLYGMPFVAKSFSAMGNSYFKNQLSFSQN